MSIVADIKQAKAEYQDHLARHKCGELSACPVRSELRQAWMGTAGLWATEPDDDQRQRDQFHRDHPKVTA